LNDAISRANASRNLKNVRPKPVVFLSVVVIAISLTLVNLPALISPPSTQAAVQPYTASGPTSSLAGDSLTATTVVKSVGQPRVVSMVGICARTTSSQTVDLGFDSNVTIPTSGRIVTKTRKLPVGKYTYWACVRETSGAWVDIGTKGSFTVPAATPTVPAATPTVPAATPPDDSALALIQYLLAVYPDTPATVPAGFAAPSQLPASARPLGADEIVFDSDRSGNFELTVMNIRGAAVRALTKDPAFDSWWPRISPNRRSIVFYRTPRGTHDLDFARTSLWAVGADGSGMTQLRPAGSNGWTFQGHAEFSPDGKALVMFGGSRFNPQIYVTDAVGQHPRAVTARPGANLDPVFTPDGKSIAFVGCPDGFCNEQRYEIYRVAITGGAPTRLTNDNVRDHDPYYSHDGTTLAWLSEISTDGPGVWDVRTAAVANMTAPQRLVGDRGITSRPQWSADDKTIYMHRIAPGGHAFGIWSVRVDGTGLTELTDGQPGTNEYPAT
jgi:Tol biopolymer transport system component